MAKAAVATATKPAAPPAPAGAASATVAAAPQPDVKVEEKAVAVAVARPLAPLIAARWSEAQYKQARHAISPEADTPYEHLFNPAYFAHLATRLLAGDVIEVRPADGAYYAELYVWDKGTNWARVSELRKIERPAVSAVPASLKGFEIDFVDGPARHRVIRSTDSAVMALGFESPDLANAWLAQNAKKIAA